MFELIPYLGYALLAILLSRSCAILLARRERQKTPGEEVMAGLHILPSRDVQAARDTASACFAVLKDGGIRRPTGWLALLHLSLWIVFALLFLAIGAGQVFRMQ